MSLSETYLGSAYCLGHTSTADDISGTFQVSLIINTTTSDSNYDEETLWYQLVLYDDEMNSLLNSSMNCVQRLDPKYTRDAVHVIQVSTKSEIITEVVKEPITREWFVYLTRCDPTKPNENYIFPIIDYTVNMTLSSYVTSVKID